MTRDDIIRLMDWHPSAKHTDTDGLLARIKKVAEAAAAAEREACAKMCEKYAEANQESDNMVDAFLHCADAIRARSKTCANGIKGRRPASAGGLRV